MQSTKILIFHHKFLISSPPREYRISPPAAVVSVREICSAVGCLRCLASAQRGSGQWTLETQDKT